MLNFFLVSLWAPSCEYSIAINYSTKNKTKRFGSGCSHPAPN
jgi:hypothetical protein